MAKAKKQPAASSPSLRLEWVDVDQLDANPANWRKHPAKQLDALKGQMSEVGWAGALLYNERTKRLIDGHARKEISQGPVPVLIGDWSEEQERKILATLDPIAGMAEADTERLDALLREVQTGSEALAAMLTELAASHEIIPGSTAAPESAPSAPELGADLQHKILVDCRDEQHQAELLERFETEAIPCKAMII
jgi:hypothetical protein